MKKKIKLPTLVLATETVRTLDQKQLAQVAGGVNTHDLRCSARTCTTK